MKFERMQKVNILVLEYICLGLTPFIIFAKNPCKFSVDTLLILWQLFSSSCRTFWFDAHHLNWPNDENSTYRWKFSINIIHGRLVDDAWFFECAQRKENYIQRHFIIFNWLFSVLISGIAFISVTKITWNIFEKLNLAIKGVS